MKNNKTIKNQPSAEDVIEISGIEILHPGGFELSKRIGELVDMKDENVLDVSCGRGVFACYYARAFGAQITGIDINPEMINSSINRAKKENVENLTVFKIANSLALPFPANSFDIVINECAVGLTTDPQKCLNEMMRVVKPEGYVVIHESLWLKELSEIEKQDIAKRLGTVPFKLSEWKEMLKNAGATNIWDEDWSAMEKMSNIRINRKVKNINEIFSLWEQLFVVAPKIIKKYGISGLLYLNESKKKLIPLYNNGALGYGLMRGQKKK